MHAVIATLAASAALSGCAGDDRPASGEAAPTYYKDVAPILQKSCVDCHAPSRIAPFSLTSYAQAKAASHAIAAETSARRMPPWGAFETDECHPAAPIRGDLHLSAEAIETLAAWDAAGAPEGDPHDAPPPAAGPSGDLAHPDLELQPKQPFVASGDHDQFRCFVLDPALTATKYLNGYQIIAGNPEVVHHVLVYVDPGRASEKKMDASGGYECFGGPDVDGVTLLGGFAPGMPAMEYGPDIGAPIPQGALLVMQVHYHPGGRQAAPDATRLAMRFSATTPRYRLDVALLGNDSGPRGNGDGLLPGPDDAHGIEFRIPADVRGHIERMRYTVPMLPFDVRIYGAANHMHYLGTDMKTSIRRAAPGGGAASEICLLQTPQWDFTWQRFYMYDAPVESLPALRSGDVVELRCAYDNTMGNPFVRRALEERHLTAPVDVRLGEETLDEMCLVALPLIRANR